MISCIVKIHIDGSPTIEELHMRIAALFALREELTVENALTEEAEQTEEALSVAVIVPLPPPVPTILHIPVEEFHVNVVPSHTWSYVGDLNATMAIIVAQSTVMLSQIYSPSLPQPLWVHLPQLRSSVGLSHQCCDHL
jgi:hypothetical protein